MRKRKTPSTRPRRFWTPAEDRELRRRYPHELTAVIAADLDRSVRALYSRAKAFGLEKTAAFLASPEACALRRPGGAELGRTTRFVKGQVPANKGLRRPGWAPGRMGETQFKAGERRGRAAKIWQPIGAERLSKDGYLERKVSEARPFQRRWRAVHLLVWEAAHGPLPTGHAVTFLNGNRRDVRLENLALISRRDLMRRNSVHTLPKPLARTIQLLGALKRQLRKREPHAQHD